MTFICDIINNPYYIVYHFLVAMAMNTEELRKNFEDQLKTTAGQISELEANLTKAKEYKTKLEGGLETLNLLEGKETPPEGDAAPEATPEEAPAE
tara:strand:- start:3021 stop:3305 length:285 start_codon:yes stop_codon:yes gene_type:complete